uniref:Uncharacterized protein n=1 Tax=Rhizophora mucronata TaxID=61149 RepID=A0A2P2QCU9_RHIMU
MEIIFLECT